MIFVIGGATGAGAVPVEVVPVATTAPVAAETVSTRYFSGEATRDLIPAKSADTAPDRMGAFPPTGISLMMAAQERHTEGTRRSVESFFAFIIA